MDCFADLFEVLLFKQVTAELSFVRSLLTEFLEFLPFIWWVCGLQRLF